MPICCCTRRSASSGSRSSTDRHRGRWNEPPATTTTSPTPRSSKPSTLPTRRVPDISPCTISFPGTGRPPPGGAPSSTVRCPRPLLRTCRRSASHVTPSPLTSPLTARAWRHAPERPRPNRKAPMTSHDDVIQPDEPQDAGTTSDDGTQLSMTTKDMRRIVGSSFMGSMIEFYDFVLYATAASIVFSDVFFSDLPEGVAVFASFATFAAGYLARPLGGLVFGHFGDRHGRKKVLILSMVLMGSASVVMGLLPPAPSIGVLAPILLVVLRLVQGIAVGGEWGGTVLMALEHAPKKNRGLAAGLANA